MPLVWLPLENVQLTPRNINGYIAVKKPGQKSVHMSKKIQFVGVKLFGNLTSLNTEKAIESLGLFYCQGPSVDRSRFISTKHMAYTLPGRGKMI